MSGIRELAVILAELTVEFAGTRALAETLAELREFTWTRGFAVL